MTANTEHLVKHLFGVDTLQDVSISQLKELVAEHPSFNIGHYLLSKKLTEGKAEISFPETQKTVLHFSNPFWLQWLLQNNDDEPDQLQNEVVVKNKATEYIEEPKVENTIREKALPFTEDIKTTTKEDVILFEPYHTIDYFASQGIKLSLEDLPKDKFGQQLKSFTEWLKIMKRLPQKTFDFSDDDNIDAAIQEIAGHSNEDKDTITETMANVLARQGKNVKAADLYSKLSLLYPDKSAYFAAKIDQLKVH